MKHIHDAEKRFYLQEATKYIDRLAAYGNNPMDSLYVDDNGYVASEYDTEQVYNIESGASKVVIIFDHKDWVIKIPFRGYVSGNSYSYSYSENEDGEVEEHEEGYGHYEFDGAYDSRLNLENRWDYCNLESKIWERADQCGIGQVFLCSMKIGEYWGVPIYIQEKAEVIGYHSEKVQKPSEDSVKKFSNKYSTGVGFSDVFGGSLLETYQEDLVEKVVDFIFEYGLSDFHGANLGYREGRPVFVDYSGYHG